MTAHNFDTLTESLTEGTRAAAVIGGKCKVYPQAGAATKAELEFGRIFAHAYGLERNDDKYSMVGARE